MDTQNKQKIWIERGESLGRFLIRLRRLFEGEEHTRARFSRIFKQLRHAA